MPFKEANTRAILITTLLVHLALSARSAPPGIFPSSASDGTAPVAAIPSPVNNNTNSESTTSVTITDLLDKNKLSFLQTCEDPKEDLICKVYGNLTLELAKRKQEVITADTINQMLSAKDEPMTMDKFCEGFAEVLQAVSKKETGGSEQMHQQNIRRPLERKVVCTVVCSTLDASMEPQVKELCRVLLWGFQKLLIPEAELNDPALQAANVVVPPLLPLNKIGEERGLELKPENKEQKTAADSKAVEVTQNSTHPDAAKPEAVVDEIRDKAVVSGITAEKQAPKSETASTQPKAVVTPKKSEDEGQDTVFADPEQKNLQNIEGYNGESNKDLFEQDSVAEGAVPPEDNLGENGYDDDDDFDSQVQTQQAPKDIPLGDHHQPEQSRQDAGKPESQGASLAEVQREEFREDPFFEESDSNFFAYFLFVMFACIGCYVAYHNKSKLLALALEGRRSSSGRGGFSKGRKHTAAYRKLDSNLEEAITSNTSASSRSPTQIIY